MWVEVWEEEHAQMWQKKGGLMKQKAKPSQKHHGRCNKRLRIQSEERKRQDKDRKTTRRGGKRGVGRWLKSCIITAWQLQHALTHMSKHTSTHAHTHASLCHLTTDCSIWHVWHTMVGFIHAGFEPTPPCSIFDSLHLFPHPSPRASVCAHCCNL